MIRAFPPLVLKFHTSSPPICFNSPFELFNLPLLSRRTMCSYLISKPLSKIDVGLINWSAEDFKNLDPESNQIAALVFFTQKLNICTIYKPMPVKNDSGSLSGIIGNMLDEKSTPAFIKIDGKEVG
jgi:hypothetical protein